jgi:uncharacterized protein (DUF2336 family)
MGIGLELMTDISASQEQSSVTAPASIQGARMADLSAQQRREVSADSFRRLTALLKKPAIPSIIATKIEAPVAAPVVAPAIVAEFFEQAVAPESVQILEVVNNSDDVAEPNIVEVQIEEPAQSAEVTTQETIEKTDMAIAAEPVAVKKPVVRQRPRDAFAVSPGILPQRQPAPQIQQTPEQEQEAAELARSLLDMMASSNSAGLPQERALAADTLLRMLPRLPIKSLVILAERVRLMDNPPTLLMAKLIADPNIVVAGPLLEDCMHITDEDLIMVIGEGDLAKIRMIARRRRLSRAITSELVNRGDDSVLLTLVRNLGAEIPQESFLDLLEFAKDYPDLLAPLCTRPDLPVPLAFELFWLAPVPLRRYLLNRFLTDSETLTKILKITRVTDGEEQDEGQFADPEKIVAALDMAGEGNMEGASAALAEYANINHVTVTRILSDKQGEPLAALLKATGVSRGQVTEIFEDLKQSASGLIDPSREVEELQSTFDSFSFNKARILLTYWDWATMKTGPYAPLN